MGPNDQDLVQGFVMLIANAHSHKHTACKKLACQPTYKLFHEVDW